MKRKIIYSVIGALVIGSVAFVTQAEGQRGRRGPRGPRGVAALELTDAQKKKMQDINAVHQKMMIDLRATQQKAQIDLGQLRGQDSPKASDIKSKVDALMTAQGNVMKREIQHGIDVKSILTPEQQKKMGEMRSNRGGRNFRGPGGQGFRGRGGQNFRGRDGRGGQNFRERGRPGIKGRNGFRGRRGAPQQAQPETQSGTMETPTETPAETSL